MILGRLRQARDPGRGSEGTKAGPEPGSGAAGLPAQSRLWLRWPRRPVGSQPCAGAAVGVRRAAPRPARVSFEPAGQACAVAAAGEDGGGRRGGAGGSGTLLRVRVA